MNTRIMKKFFVSYTIRGNEIDKCFLEKFSENLKILGKVYIDLINNDSIDKQKRVFEELGSSNFIILIESKETYYSKWVTLEIEKAKAKNIPIITIPIKEFDNGKELDFIKSELKRITLP